MDDTSKFAAPVPRRNSCADDWDDNEDDKDEDHDGDDDDNHIDKESQAKSSPLHCHFITSFQTHLDHERREKLIIVTIISCPGECLCVSMCLCERVFVSMCV